MERSMAKKRKKAKVEMVRVDIPTEEAHSQASEAYWWGVPWVSASNASAVVTPSGAYGWVKVKGAAVDNGGNVDYGYRCTNKASCQDPADSFPYPKRETVLEEAERLTASVKPEAYDHPAINFARLGKVWAAILKLDHDIPSEMVALMMACHKLVRESHKHERDNVVDACGYLRCVEKIREKEMRLP